MGRIVGAFGLQGELKVEPLTDFLERLQKGARLRLKGDWVEVTGFRLHKNRPLLRLSGITTVDQAEALQWELLHSEDASRPPLEDDEFFTSDLIGMEVWTTDGQQLGHVDEVMATPAHDVLQVGKILIPAVKAFVKDVDLDHDRLTVQLIPGMLED